MTGPKLQSPRPAPARPRRGGVRSAVAVGVVVAAALALALILAHCARSGQGPSGAGRAMGPGGPGGRGGGRPPTTVAVAKATVGSAPVELSALGTVTPLATVNVNARVAGMLERVDFREGQLVRAGQPLAQIDPRPFTVALQQAQAQLAHDQALLRNANLDLARYRTLRAQNSIAGQQVDTQAALVKQDEATLQADQAALDNARLNLSYTRITSPVSGRLGLRQIDAGNQITANAATPIVVVTKIDPISVVFSVPESAIAGISTSGRAGREGLPVTAFDRTGGTVLARGRLATLDNVIDTTTGTVKAKAVFPNAAATLFPNQFVSVVVLVDTLENQIIVPTTAVRHGPQGDFVWVLQPDRTVRVRPVKVGVGAAETVTIQTGLRAGETVITEGGDRLRDGAKVALPGQRPASGGGGDRGHGHRQGGGWAPAGG